MKKRKKLIVFLFGAILILAFTGCFKSEVREALAVPSPCSGTPGPLFLQVKNLVASKCAGCHNSVISNGGKDFSVDCNIIDSQSRIKVRAVDQGNMPPPRPLTQSEKNVITDWMAAGGKYTN